MKKSVIWLSAFMLIATLAYPNLIKPDKMPLFVKQSFTEKFPNVKDVRCTKNRNDYKITFDDNGMKRFARFDAYGKWLETATEVKIAGIPAEIRTSVAKNFEGYSISEPVRVETPDLAPFYRMELHNGNIGYEVRFSPLGEILQKTELEDEDYDDEVN
jgi:hypothetical protein